jgi:hypothetical protein
VLQALKDLESLIRAHLWKVLLLFVMSGLSAVLGIVPGTEQVSNVLGGQINTVKADLGTAVSPTAP